MTFCIAARQPPFRRLPAVDILPLAPTEMKWVMCPALRLPTCPGTFKPYILASRRAGASRANLAAALKQLAQTRDLLAALSGGLPSDRITQQFVLTSLQLPRDLPLSLHRAIRHFHPEPTYKRYDACG